MPPTFAFIRKNKEKNYLNISDLKDGITEMENKKHEKEAAEKRFQAASFYFA
jgi:hypothetical protein